MRRVVLAVLLLVGVVALGGCAGTREAERQETSTRAELPTIAEAKEFGGMVLPPKAEMLGLDADHGIDSLVRFAVVVRPEQVDQVLADSRFHGQFRPGPPPGLQVLDEVPIGPAVSSGEDELAAGPHRPNAVFRHVMIDRSHDRPVIHVWAFTT